MPQFTQAPRPRNVRDAEREHILSVVEQVQGDRRKAIAILGISERALRYKLKAYRELENAGNGELINANPEAETFASQVNTSTTS
jgi:DNA-binding NtrC family response regulator